MACSRPELASHGVCAIVIPITDPTTTSIKRAMVPNRLRVRMVMADMCSLKAVARRKGRTIRGAPIQSSTGSRHGFDRYFRTKGSARPRDQVVAVFGRRPDRDHG